MSRDAELWVIEDQPENIQLLREAMRLCDFRCEMAVTGDGGVAMQEVQQYRLGRRPLPDLILLDLNLPNISGQELLQAIKGDSVLRIIPVVVLSGSNSPKEIELVYKLNANAYVLKPDRLDEIVSFVASLRNFWLRVAILPTQADPSAAGERSYRLL